MTKLTSDIFRHWRHDVALWCWMLSASYGLTSAFNPCVFIVLQLRFSNFTFFLHVYKLTVCVISLCKLSRFIRF